MVKNSSKVSSNSPPVSHELEEEANSLKIVDNSPLYENLKTNYGPDPKSLKIQVVWDSIHYSIDTKKGKQEILKGISGSASPGEFVAIMGSSGAGKTTLLNIIAGRISSFHNSYVTGSVKANGANISSIKFDQFSTYITQEDILLPTLTIRECFEFSARMRLKGTRTEILEKVEKTITDLKLEKVADNVVGSVLRKGISGGERKRTCIGVEIITDPAVIILDEPTSGLDSFTAEAIVDLLIEQTNKGKTVIATIHQPSSNVFKKFSKLILLCEGYTIYQGPPEDSRKYFSKLGYKCPSHVNPADFYMRLLHVVNRFDKTPEEEEKLNHLADAYKECEENEIPNKSWKIKAITVWNFYKKLACYENALWRTQSEILSYLE